MSAFKKNFQFEILSDFQYLPYLRRIFPALRTKRASALTQILVEAYNNAVVHGHHRGRDQWVGIHLEVSRTQVRIRVKDGGKGSCSSPTVRRSYAWKTTGRGLTLIQAYAGRIKNYRRGPYHIFEALCFL